MNLNFSQLIVLILLFTAGLVGIIGGAFDNATLVPRLAVDFSTSLAYTEIPKGSPAALISHLGREEDEGLSPRGDSEPVSDTSYWHSGKRCRTTIATQESSETKNSCTQETEVITTLVTCTWLQTQPPYRRITETTESVSTNINCDPRRCGKDVTVGSPYTVFFGIGTEGAEVTGVGVKTGPLRNSTHLVVRHTTSDGIGQTTTENSNGLNTIIVEEGLASAIGEDIQAESCF
jgi:hypothetical protein